MRFDTKDFRRALSKFPTGVTVITTRDADGKPVGMTASSFNTLSIDPPLILWSIDRGAYSLEAFAQGEHFAVNILRNDQVEMSNRFARRGEDKFAGLSLQDGELGDPLLNDTAACLECRTWQIYEGGDHLIIVGEVIKYRYEDGASSLVFHDGRYAIPETHPLVKPPAILREEHTPVGDNVLYLLRETLSVYRHHFYPRLSSFGLNQEEWRVLILLAGGKDMSFEYVSEFVWQPIGDLRDTGEWLQEKGLITLTSSSMCLTEAGRKVAHQLLDMAVEHEREALSHLDEAERAQFKENLKRLIKGLR